MSEDTTKLQLFGLLAKDPKLDIRTVVQEFDVSIHTLRKWKKEYDQGVSLGCVEKLIDLDTVVADEIIDIATNKVMDAVEEAIPEPLVIDETTNEVVTESELKKRELEYTERRNMRDAISNKFKSGISELKNLNEATQDTALDLVSLIAQRISQISEIGDRQTVNGKKGGAALGSYTRDLVDLSSALSGIQNAFFNKPSISVNVNQENKVGLLGNFRENLKN